MIEQLTALAKILNEHDILWVVGASLVLKRYGLVDEPRDIDLIIAPESILETIEVLDSVAQRKSIPIKSEYKTKYFLVYEFMGVDVDVMSGFRILHGDKIYQFPFDDKSIASVDILGGESVNYGSLEDWYVAYHLMKGRGGRLIKIRQYWNEGHQPSKILFKRWLAQGLPEAIVQEIEKM